MKKSFWIVMILIGLMVASVYGGELTELGIKGGLSHSNFSDKDHSFWDSKNGPLAGAYLTYSFSDTFGVQLEGLYVMKGSKVSESGVNAKTELNYAEINLLAVLQAPTYPHTKVLLGPGIGFYLTGEARYNVNDSRFPFSGTRVIETTDVNSPEYLFITGIEYRRSHLLIGARYAWGLNHVFTKDYWDFNVKNTTLQVLAGFYF